MVERYLVTARRQALHRNPGSMCIMRTVFQRELNLLQRVVENNGLLLGEAIPIHLKVEAFRAGNNIESIAQAVFRNDLKQTAFVLQLAPIGIPAKDRIIADDGRGRAQCGAEAQVNFTRVPPGPTSHFLVSQPSSSPWPGLEATTSPAIIFFSRKPIAVIGLWRAGIDQGPRTQIGRVSEV